MLRYLDLGQSTGKAPNENYSRELMELFTMGVGTFTEDDVRAGAKALAGWREPLTVSVRTNAMISIPFLFSTAVPLRTTAVVRGELAR